MEGAQRLAVLSALLAAGACTMIGSPELTSPPSGVDAEGGSAVVARTEPPSRVGNMSSYEQNGRTYRVLDSSYGYDERGIASW